MAIAFNKVLLEVFLDWVFCKRKEFSERKLEKISENDKIIVEEHFYQVSLEFSEDFLKIFKKSSIKW